LIGLG
jgi:hypothetical protein